MTEFAQLKCHEGERGVAATNRAPFRCRACGLMVRAQTNAAGKWFVEPHWLRQKDVVATKRQNGFERFMVRAKKERA